MQILPRPPPLAASGPAGLVTSVEVHEVGSTRPGAGGGRGERAEQPMGSAGYGEECHLSHREPLDPASLELVHLVWFGFTVV